MTLRLFFTLCALLGFAAAGQAFPVELQPYRAVYDLELSQARSGSGITALTGLLVLEWADACDGYTLNQRLGFRITRARAGEIASDFHVSTWESRDGTVLRYNIRNTVNGTVIEEFRGRAELVGPGRGGTATFTKPKPMTVELPPGTIFPTEYTRVLVERALAGEQRLVRTVFEGSYVDKLYRTVAFLGRAIPPGMGGQRHDLLEGLQSWSVQIAYFPLGGASEMPDYEVGLRLFDNGIGDKVRLDYGDFIIGGELTRLEALPPSGC